MPIKFDDLSKVATEVLNDDFVSGHTIKTKQKTNWDGSVLSTQVDLFDKNCATPAKITVKMPKPMGCSHVSVDKLEVDKAGKFKLEASSMTTVPGLKLEGKSDLVAINKIMAGCTYTGLKDAQFKLECQALDPRQLVAEATYARGEVTCGAKLTPAVLSKGAIPDIGVRFLSKPYFCSLVAKDNFGSLNAAGCYTVNPDVKVAASYQHQFQSGAGSFVIGLLYRDLYKIKVCHDQSVHVSAKHNLAKGFNLIGGGKYDIKKDAFSYGVQLSIE